MAVVEAEHRIDVGARYGRFVRCFIEGEDDRVARLLGIGSCCVVSDNTGESRSCGIG